MGYIGITEHWGDGKENGNYYSIIAYILGLFRDNIGIMENCYSIIGYISG